MSQNYFAINLKRLEICVLSNLASINCKRNLTDLKVSLFKGSRSGLSTITTFLLPLHCVSDVVKLMCLKSTHLANDFKYNE